MWALELLAWSPDYFDDAVRVLAQLAAIDPGGEWSNRPDKSLSEILSCWHPCTSAPLDQRLRAIEALPRYQPDIWRKILFDLVPEGHGFQTEHTGPRFHDWKVETPVPHADMVRVATKAIDMLLNGLGDDASHYISLIEKLGYVSEEHRKTLAEKITSLSDRLTDDEARSALFHALRKFIARHREYSDAEWALPAFQLHVLEAAARSIQPLDLVQKNKWLFENSWVELGDLSRREDFDAYNIAVNERRAAAVGEILRRDGLSAVEKLAAGTQCPHLVGYALAEEANDQDNTLLAWLSDEDPSRSSVALGYFAQRLRVQDPSRLDDLLSATDDALVQARLLRSTRDPAAAWARLAAMNDAVASHYWREFEYYGLGGDFQHALTAARSLITAGRHAAALDLIVLYERRNDTSEAAEVAALALEGLVTDGLNDPSLGRLQIYGFRQIFSLLSRHREAIGTQRVVHLEFQLLPALGFDAEAPTLHASVAEDSAFFAELVAYAFRADHETDDVNQVDEGALEQRRVMARRAYEVLHTWRRCPGVGVDGTLDALALQVWVATARTHLETKDRLASGERQIGSVLAFAPADPDGTYPPVAVRELLESLQSNRVDDGLESSIYNKRGFTSRGMTDGGAQEWKLAEKYRISAGQSTSWPRTRKLFAKLAESYERDARREDEEAELRRRGLHE